MITSSHDHARASAARTGSDTSPWRRTAAATGRRAASGCICRSFRRRHRGRGGYEQAGNLQRVDGGPLAVDEYRPQHGERDHFQHHDDGEVTRERAWRNRGRSVIGMTSRNRRAVAGGNENRRQNIGFKLRPPASRRHHRHDQPSAAANASRMTVPAGTLTHALEREGRCNAGRTRTAIRPRITWTMPRGFSPRTLCPSEGRYRSILHCTARWR